MDSCDMTIRTNTAIQTLDGTSRPSGMLLSGNYRLGKVIMEYNSTAYTTTSGTLIDLISWTNQTGFTGGSRLELSRTI